MMLRQLTQESCTLACFESFLGQNGIIATQRWMKKMRPDICGDLNEEQRCVYTHHYSEVGQVFGFTCIEITDVYLVAAALVPVDLDGRVATLNRDDGFD
jgi:hypothetical protein